MILIFGLGNPEREYRYTRHNTGFEVINKLSYDLDIPINKQKFKAHVGEGFVKTKKIMLLKPQTYMNLSGQSVREAVNFFKLTNKDIIVIYDDTSIPVGDIKIKTKGTAGGHNGIKDIIHKLDTDEFTRIKVGIGEKPKNYVLSDYVLSGFSKPEWEKMIEGMTKAGDACEMIVTQGVDTAMNKFNVKRGCENE